MINTNRALWKVSGIALQSSARPAAPGAATQTCLPCRTNDLVPSKALSCLAVLAALMLSTAAPARAKTCEVLTPIQDDFISVFTMSLRHALADPNCDTINIAAQGTITLTSPLPTIDRNLTISGPGADRLTVRTAENQGDYRI